MQPIFIVHEGSQSYIRHAIEFSRANGNYTALIGTDHYLGSLCSAYYDSKNINSVEYSEFIKNYVHMSSNSEEFELLCFKRYFYLLHVVKSKKINAFWMIDSDVLLLENLSIFGRNVLAKNNYTAALSTQIQHNMEWASSPHISFWTLDALSCFVNFLTELYKGSKINQLRIKYDYHIHNNISGGVCDMTALFLWQKEKGGDIFNTARAHLDGYPLFDHNINLSSNFSANEFTTIWHLNVKKVIHINKEYFVKLRQSSITIPVASLHFQGSAKKIIPIFARFKQINFSIFILLKVVKWSIWKQGVLDFLYLYFFSFINIFKNKYISDKSINSIIEPEIKMDDFYNDLCCISQNPELKTFLEIGSSSGGGSTQAFVSSIRQRPDKNSVRFFCMEISKTRFNSLVKNYKYDLFVKPYNISSISLRHFPSRNNIIKFYNNINTKLNNSKLSSVLYWHCNDINYIKNSGNDHDGIELIMSKNNILFFDVVLIDGSEFTGEQELKKIIGAKIIALDDTETYKCFNAMHILRLDENYRLLVHRPDIRNGYAIFVRKDFNFQTLETQGTY